MSAYYNGHKVSKPSTLPACGGYNECGILAMHSDHKVEINKAKKEIKTLTKKLKDKKKRNAAVTQSLICCRVKTTTEK